MRQEPTRATEAQTILVSLDRELVERLVPGAIRDAALRSQGFTDVDERRTWIAGRIGLQLEAVLR